MTPNRQTGKDCDTNLCVRRTVRKLEVTRKLLEHDDVAEKDTGKPYLTALLKNVDRKAETLIR